MGGRPAAQAGVDRDGPPLAGQQQRAAAALGEVDGQRRGRAHRRVGVVGVGRAREVEDDRAAARRRPRAGCARAARRSARRPARRCARPGHRAGARAARRDRPRPRSGKTVADGGPPPAARCGETRSTRGRTSTSSVGLRPRDERPGEPERVASRGPPAAAARAARAARSARGSARACARRARPSGAGARAACRAPRPPGRRSARSAPRSRRAAARPPATRVPASVRVTCAPRAASRPRRRPRPPAPAA